jgi:hypothetical protein
MTDATAPNAIVTNAELRLAYCPVQGRMWRTNMDGVPIRELVLLRWDESEDRCRVKINTIRVAGRHRVLTHVIHYIMTNKWPLSGMYIDHIDRDPTNNTFANLREVTPTQNAMNTDRGGKYWRGRDQVLEQGVTLTRSGT